MMDSPVRIEKGLVRSVKIEAAKEGISIRSWIERAVKKSLTVKSKKG